MARYKLVGSISVCLFASLATVGCTRERVVVVHDAPPPAYAQQPAPAYAEAPAAAPEAAQPAPVEESQDVEVANDPPPEQVEAVPVSPGPNYVWIKGHWRWAGRWVWTPGHWDAVRRGHEWVAGHWEHRRGRRWIWVPGHWRRL